MELFLVAAMIFGTVGGRDSATSYIARANAELVHLVSRIKEPLSPVPVRIVEQPDAKTDADRLREQAADDREIKDLIVQERLKDIAQNTFNLSIFQLLLTVIGTAGLLYSLRLARQSTKAAVAAVQVTTQTSRDQLRAYVLVDSNAIVFDPAGRAGVVISFRNGGQSPALDMVIGCQMKVDDINFPTDMQPVEFNPMMSRFSVLPAGTRQKEIGPVNPLQAHALAVGETIMHVWGEVRYRDIFDRHHYSRFHLIGGGKYGFQNGVALIVNGEGNIEGEYLT
jgi:hypothetical protein